VGVVIGFFILLLFGLCSVAFEVIFLKNRKRSKLLLVAYLLIFLPVSVGVTMLVARVLPFFGVDPEFAGTGLAYIFGIFLCLILLVWRVCFLFIKSFRGD
jgi:cation transporter-like permease